MMSYNKMFPPELRPSHLDANEAADVNRINVNETVQVHKVHYTVYRDLPGDLNLPNVVSVCLIPPNRL